MLYDATIITGRHKEFTEQLHFPAYKIQYYENTSIQPYVMGINANFYVVKIFVIAVFSRRFTIVIWRRTSPSLIFMFLVLKYKCVLLYSCCKWLVQIFPTGGGFLRRLIASVTLKCDISNCCLSAVRGRDLGSVWRRRYDLEVWMQGLHTSAANLHSRSLMT